MGKSRGEGIHFRLFKYLVISNKYYPKLLIICINVTYSNLFLNLIHYNIIMLKKFWKLLISVSSNLFPLICPSNLTKTKLNIK